MSSNFSAAVVPVSSAPAVEPRPWRFNPSTRLRLTFSVPTGPRSSQHCRFDLDEDPDFAQWVEQLAAALLRAGQPATQPAAAAPSVQELVDGTDETTAQTLADLGVFVREPGERQWRWHAGVTLLLTTFAREAGQPLREVHWPLPHIARTLAWVRKQRAAMPDDPLGADEELVLHRAKLLVPEAPPEVSGIQPSAPLAVPEQAALATAAQQLTRCGQATLRGVLDTAELLRWDAYCKALYDAGYFPPMTTDSLRRSTLYAQAAIRLLHEPLAKLLSTVAGEPLEASYCILARYFEGATLPRHTDRPQCVWNFSLVLHWQAQQAAPSPWPFFVEGAPGVVSQVLLRPGDGVFYRGTDAPHWRDALPPGQATTVAFFHFVPPTFQGHRS